ncbi:MAG: ferrous iron transport protein B [Cytophagales bacterium]
MADEKLFKITLIGNPNSGKTTLFNQLTGLNQKVGNFPGVTVERKSGLCKLADNQVVQIIDLPGTYSIYPKSYDEEIVFDVITNPSSTDYPDLIVVVVDASNLKRNLLLFTQIFDLGLPVILCLNMIDVTEKAGLKIFPEKLSSILEGCEVLTLNARKGVGLEHLKIAIKKEIKKDFVRRDLKFITAEFAHQKVFEEVGKELNCSSLYIAELIAHQYKTIRWIPAFQKIKIAEVLKRNGFESVKIQTQETILRYQKINQLYDASVNAEAYNARHRISERLDRIFTNRFFGYFTLIAIFYLVFQAIFTWSSLPMELIDNGIAQLNSFIKFLFPKNIFIDLLTDGVISGLGGVLVFIPQIAFLFTFIAVLEETGYMARVMFLMDNLMKPFGLNGKSVVPLFSGAACAIPAIMATRNIGNSKERLITIFVTPLISCSARIPVYTIIIAIVIPNKNIFGFLNLQGLTMMLMYLLGFVMALISALLLKMIVKTGEKSFFILEMPDYKMPKWRNVGLSVVEKVQAFVFGAGKVIISISVVLWFLSTYGPKEAMQNAENEAIARYKKSSFTLTANKKALENEISASKLEASFAGHFGKFIEPAIAPIGFDWKIGIAVITSFAAREVFVGTISTIYSVGEGAEVESLKDKLKKQTDPATGKPFFDFARGMSLLVFYAFALQCMSTIAVVKNETGKWSIAIYQFIYLGILAYLSAFLTYQLLN